MATKKHKQYKKHSGKLRVKKSKFIQHNIKLNNKKYKYNLDKKYIDMNAKKYTENLSEPWFSLILLGLKTVEGRKNKGRFNEMRVGDIIEWINNNFNPRSVSTIITKKIEYKTFKEYLEIEGLNKCLPGINNIEDGLSVYFKYFTKEDETKYGVMAIGIQIVHTIDIQNPKECPTFDYIESNVKTVEGRKYAPKYHNLKINDMIKFVCGDKILMKTIKAIRLYKTLEDYLDIEGFKNVLPCVDTFEKALKLYNTWSNSKDRNKLMDKYGYGFMAIELK